MWKMSSAPCATSTVPYGAEPKGETHIDHFGGMETRGLSLGFRWLARNHDFHGTRVALVVDATAVLGAASTCQSSATNLRQQIGQCSAIVLAVS